MVSNRGKITIFFYPLPFEIETRIFFIMIAFFLAGATFGILIMSKNLFKKTLENANNRRKIKKLEKVTK